MSSSIMPLSFRLISMRQLPKKGHFPTSPLPATVGHLIRNTHKCPIPPLRNECNHIAVRTVSTKPLLRHMSNNAGGGEKPPMTQEQIEAIEKDAAARLALHKNPYFDKYADQINKMQRTSPEEFLIRLSALPTPKNLLKKKPGRDPATTDESEASEKGFSTISSQPKTKAVTDFSQLPEKKLSSLMKLELVKDKTRDEIADIWRQYHYGDLQFSTKSDGDVDKSCSSKDKKKPGVLAAVIPADIFKVMSQRFQQHKTFLLPLPRREGYEFVVVQFQGNEAHFTTLLNYQTHKENSPECLTVVNYPEFNQEKGITLMRATYDDNILSQMDADCLCIQMLQYYGGSGADSNKLSILERFTHDTDNFYVWDLIAELESGRDPKLFPFYWGR